MDRNTYRRFDNVRRACRLVGLLLLVGSFTRCSSGDDPLPVCASPEVCVGGLVGGQPGPSNFSRGCMRSCELDAGDCPAGETCEFGFACCSGTACAAAMVKVCVASGTDAGADGG
jgi:hypothetical protein